MGSDFDLTKYCKYSIEGSLGLNVISGRFNSYSNAFEIYQTQYKKDVEVDLLDKAFDFLAKNDQSHQEID